VGAFPQLLEGPVTDLPDPLTGDTQERTDLLEGPLFPVVQPVVEVEDLPLPLREVLLEHVFEVVSAGDGLYVFFDIASLRSREPFAKGGAVPVTPVDGGIQTQLARCDSTEGPDGLQRLTHLLGQLLVGGSPPQLLRQSRIGAGELCEIGVLVEWDADRAGLLSESLKHGLADPPYGIGDELYALVRIEFLDGLQKSLIPYAYELGKAQPTALVFLYIGNDKPEVGRDQTFGRFLVANPGSTGQCPLLSRILNEGILLNVLQILIEGVQTPGS